MAHHSKSTVLGFFFKMGLPFFILLWYLSNLSDIRSANLVEGVASRVYSGNRCTLKSHIQLPSPHADIWSLGFPSRGVIHRQGRLCTLPAGTLVYASSFGTLVSVNQLPWTWSTLGHWEVGLQLVDIIKENVTWWQPVWVTFTTTQIVSIGSFSSGVCRRLYLPLRSEAAGP